MSLTNAEKQELLDAIKAESQSVDELVEVTTLDNVKSLPAMRGEELVSVPVPLLRKPAEDAARSAEAAAAMAVKSAGTADTAAGNADAARERAAAAAAVAEAAAGVAGEAARKAEEAASGINDSLPGDMTAVPDVENDTVRLTLLGKSGAEIASVDIPGGTGSGGNTYNVTAEVPLQSGYYTLATAIAAVEDRHRSKGLCITYEKSQGRWETKQFTGTSLSVWEQEASWEDFGGGGTVRSLTVNGEKRMPDGEGNVNLTIDKLEVDEGLDAESTNPVENKAVTARLQEVEAGTVFGMSAELSDDESSVRLALTNKSGAEIASVDLPAGSGGGGESSTTKIVLTAGTDKRTVKEGGAVKLTYTYDHQVSGGDSAGSSTGQKAVITIQVKRGTTTTYSATLKDVGKGTYSLDLTKYLLVGTSDIYVVAETTDPETGRSQKKQAYVSVKSVTLSLSSGYNLASTIRNGGYGAYDTAGIPYAVSGTGTKTVSLYVDGVQQNAHTVTRSGTTNGSFEVSMTGLAVGRHTVQLVAELEADDLTLKSESIHIDLLKAGTGAPFIGLKMVHADGRILGRDDHLRPVLEAGRYEKLSFDWVAYDPDRVPADVEFWKNGVKGNTVIAPRSMMTYSNRFTEEGTQTLTLKAGNTEYPLQIDVTPGGIDLGEASYGLAVKLDASGRSNGESDPGRWESNGVQTRFEGFDWSSNGWTGEALKLTGGAKAVIGYRPFAADVKSTGLTIELTLRVSNPTDNDAAVVECLDGGKGLYITSSEAGFKTGEKVSYPNEDDEVVEREIGLGTNYVSGRWIKVALMVGTREENRLMELYVDGNRTGADIYDNAFSFRQDNPREITVDSSGADVEVRTVRIYTRRLSDDEELENRMVDCPDGEEMIGLYEENDILGDTDTVDLDKLRARGKGVLRIVRTNKLDDIYAENNKKTDFSADIFYYSPFGAEHDFVLRDCYIRIQGTSSTKYPSKNLRIYLSKGGANLSFTVGGREQAEKKYPVRPGGIPMNLICLKSDYSDSSMSLNTGGAKLFNDVLKEMGLLTPAQRYQYEQSGGDLNAVTVRTAIDGVPVDLFVSGTEDGENDYAGQYNFNNEKSKSGDLFGLSGLEGYTPPCPLTLEMLNNTEPMCLFRTTSDAHLEEVFDAGAETNVPDDVKWAGLSTARQTAVKRLYGWIRSCVPDGATSADLSTFKSGKFKDEIGDYFDKAFLLTYYLWTDYFLAVDQRAKNMMLRTWDGLKWYITYYDGDTQMGKRNDCFLVYDYTTDRDTYDAEAGKYAFEGRDSWLWNLVLANLEDDLRIQAQALRSVLTVDRVLDMLNVEQAGNWCDRAYNKSGELKYILPATREMYGKVWPFIYALQGSNRAHREYFVRNRFALLDARYGTSNFTSDNIDLYLARTSSDVPDVLRITAGEVYAFGYGTNNSPNIGNTGIVRKDATASLSIGGAYTVNDPLRVYGASRMKVLDMSGAADHLKNAFDLGKCTILRELNLQSDGTGSTGWWLNIGNCKQLRKLNLRNQAQAKTGGSTSTELDLGAQTKLEELEARGTQVQSVVLAKGAPVTQLHLPGTVTTLRLEYLGKLTPGGLTLESYGKVKTFIFDSCPHLDWETLLDRCTNVERVRVTGIDREDDGTWLNRFLSLGGVDTEGNTTDTCALVGTVRLTRYLEGAEYEKTKAHFPELNILQPEYTMIEFDDSVADDANVSNLDNKTGYKYGNEYKPSGHIEAILKKRHRVLAKVTKKPTTQNVKIAGVDTIMNNLDGEMTYYPLHDANSNYYADAEELEHCSSAKLDGTEGDFGIIEPHRWTKGINDYLNGKHYSCYSSNEGCPAIPEATVIGWEEIRGMREFRKGYRIAGGRADLESSFSADGNYSACCVEVSGYKKVRFPSVPGTNMTGSIFVDGNGTILKSITLQTLSNKFEAGMYLISDVPEGATHLYFSVLNTAEFDKVVLSNSDRIEDMEPDWVEEDATFVAAVGSSVVGDKLRACITGGSTASNMPWSDFHYYSVARGMQQIDPLMHNWIANLFYARYGRRDSQAQCGAGIHSNNRKTGGTVERGMTDTIGFDAAKAIDGSLTPNLVDGLNPQYAWYKDEDEWGNPTIKRVDNICCLGYEDIYGHKYDMMDRVDLPNDSGNAYKWRIWMPDGTIRMVKGSNSNDQYITAVAHGKYMDVIPVGNVAGSYNTHYCDKYWVSGAASRVVYRGYSNASPSGGVSHANADYDASYTDTYRGSRLAFRGKLVRASSVVAFKSFTEVA